MKSPFFQATFRGGLLTQRSFRAFNASCGSFLISAVPSSRRFEERKDISTWPPDGRSLVLRFWPKRSCFPCFWVVLGGLGQSGRAQGSPRGWIDRGGRNIETARGSGLLGFGMGLEVERTLDSRTVLNCSWNAMLETVGS